MPQAHTFNYHKIKNFPSRYLKTYYENIDPDELAVMKFLVKEGKKVKKKSQMLEIGCGPTIHHILPFVEYVSQIDMADFLKENLLELAKWIDNKPDSHNWNIFTKKILVLEGKKATKLMIEKRENILRKLVGKIMECNVLNKLPLGHLKKYEIVGFFYCAEEVGLIKPKWEKIMIHVSQYVKKGGHFFIAALNETHHYSIVSNNGKLENLPTAYLTAKDFKELLPKLGFPSKKTKIKTVKTPDQLNHGINGVILISAQKAMN